MPMSVMPKILPTEAYDFMLNCPEYVQRTSPKLLQRRAIVVKYIRSDYTMPRGAAPRAAEEAQRVLGKPVPPGTLNSDAWAMRQAYLYLIGDDATRAKMEAQAVKHVPGLTSIPIIKRSGLTAEQILRPPAKHQAPVPAPPTPAPVPARRIPIISTPEQARDLLAERLSKVYREPKRRDALGPQQVEPPTPVPAEPSAATAPGLITAFFESAQELLGSLRGVILRQAEEVAAAEAAQQDLSRQLQEARRDNEIMQRTLDKSTEDIVHREEYIHLVEAELEDKRSKTLEEAAQPYYATDPQLQEAVQAWKRRIATDAIHQKEAADRLPVNFQWGTHTLTPKYMPRFVQALAALPMEDQLRTIRALETMTTGAYNGSLQTHKNEQETIPYTPPGNRTSRVSDALRFSWDQSGHEIVFYYIYRKSDTRIRQSEGGSGKK